MSRNPRSAQNLAFALSALLVAAVAATPFLTTQAVHGWNGMMSAHKTREYAHLRTADITSATYVFYNTSGSLVKTDVTSQVGTSIIDVPNANAGGVEGIQIDSILLGATGYGGANETDPARPSYIELTLANASVGRYLDAPLSSIMYTFRVLAGGQYTPNTVNATPQDYHTSTSPDFGLRVAFAQGDTSILAASGMTLAEGSSTAGNYTRKADVNVFDLMRADVAGKDFQADYDNPAFIRIEGYKAGRNGNLGDSVRVSVQFLQPDGPAVFSYRDGYALFFLIASAALIVGALFVSPLWSFRDFPGMSRPAPAAAATKSPGRRRR